jgi:hypothetical protein
LSHRSGLDCFAKLGEAAAGENRSGEAGLDRNEAVERIRSRKSAAVPPESLLVAVAYSTGIRTLSGEAGPENGITTGSGKRVGSRKRLTWFRTGLQRPSSHPKVFFNGENAIYIQASQIAVTVYIIRCAKQKNSMLFEG